MTSKYYAGIGARITPDHICRKMTLIAKELEKKGYILRSGHADGADMAFENGVSNPTMKEIWIPHLGFNGSDSLLTPIPEAFDIAEKFHPAWWKCSPKAKKLHARNVHQILGADLKTMVDFVICWTADGKASGGTGQALRIANHYGIEIRNLHEKAVNNEDPTFILPF